MFIDEKKRPRRFPLLRSPLSIAVAALAACVVMMLVLVESPMADSRTPAESPAAQAFQPASSVADQHLALAVVIGGFMLTAGGGFVLSRRSIRAAVKAENERKRR